MVDTLHIWQPGKVERLDLSNVENLTESVKAFTGETYYTGNLNNLRLSVSDRGVSIKGSFSKFLKGTNLEPLNSKEFQKAIEVLENILNVNLREAIINRIDLSGTLQMDYKPEAYYPYLGNCGRMRRSVFGNTLYYSQINRQMLFYDKSKESKKDLPFEYLGKSLLRFEVQFLKSIAAQFKVDKLRVKHLLCPDYYDSLKDRWKAEFEKIHKVEMIIKQPEAITTPKEFWNEIIKECIQEKGFNQIEKEIETVKHTGMKPRSVTRLKQDLKSLTAGGSTGKSLINELETKVFSY